MGKKTPKKKAKLRKAHKRARPVPVFIRIKTARRVMSSPRRRHWQRGKLKIKEKKKGK